MICFSRSSLTWLTKSESSHGFFRLDALLDCKRVDSSDTSRFLLASSVPAGRMYETLGPLVRDPGYFFQMISGLDEHTILRRDLVKSPPVQSFDSSDLNSQYFESLTWDIISVSSHRESADRLFNIPCQTPLNILLEFRCQQFDFRLEAPLLHWNYRHHHASWQIETGPLLWPLDTYDSFSPRSSALTTAWIHANKDNRITISGDRLEPHEIDAQLSLLVPL